MGERLVAKVEGEGHTVQNLLRDYILSEEGVEMAAYSFEHPLSKTASVVIQTRGRDPKEVVARAAKRLIEDLSKAEEFFQKLKSGGATRRDPVGG